ncbi:MAG: hypothetical protein CVU05_05420 [Bacteroidetes bacterium HGW-Bacteroidetes-21]|jgi:signal transduction histidine kinase|nr:MAG: hypothetical protein CVU05_05420 [Bacteroidetes bacterium HGW-Bacteroidetes-21]
MIKSVIFLFILFAFTSVKSQSEANIDSLSNISEKSVPYKTYFKIRNDIGNYYVINGQYEIALKVYFDILKIAEYKKDSSSIALLYNNIATIYRETGKNELILQYAKKAVDLCQYITDDSQKADVHNTLANYYYENYIDSLALKHFNISHQYRLLAGVKKEIAVSFKNLGAVCFETGQKQKGIQYVFNSLAIRKEINDKAGIISSYLGLGEMYNAIEKKDSAIFYLNLGLSMSDSTISPYIIRQYYDNMALIYASIHNFDSAYAYQVKLTAIKDSILNKENNGQMADLQTKYDTEKKEQALLLKSLEIAQEKDKNLFQLFLFTGIAILIIVISGFIIYRNQQKQKSALINETNRQEKLRFKAVIDSEEKERIRVAKELHDGLGQLLSSAKLNMSSLEDSIEKEDELLLKNSLHIIDEAVNEVRTISHNLMPTALMNYDIVKAISVLTGKINDSGTIQVDFDSTQFTLSLLKETEITLYRIVQEIVNNMIKHAQTQKIYIQLYNQKEEIMLLIKDYGKGFNLSEIKQSSGIGWQNLYSRVSMLNGEIIVDSQPEKGTTISVTFTM